MTETTIDQPFPAASSHNIALPEAFRVWVRVAIYSFGGPARQMQEVTLVQVLFYGLKSEGLAASPDKPHRVT